MNQAPLVKISILGGDDVAVINDILANGTNIDTVQANQSHLG